MRLITSSVITLSGFHRVIQFSEFETKEFEFLRQKKRMQVVLVPENVLPRLA